MRSVTYKAPAKVILSGEHAVVYGKPALISGLGQYITITVSDGKSDEGTISEIIQPVIEVVQKHLKNASYPEVSISFQNEIPIGRGLGSSAAGAVALTAALVHFYTGKAPEKDLINTLAYKAEKHFHGTPSGADNTTCCFGGLIFYRKEFEFLKTISALNCKLPEAIESKLFLIDTGKPLESTAEMVKQVSLFYNGNPAEADEILYKIEKTTKRMVVSVIKEDIEGFRKAIEENHNYLVQLGVVSQNAINLLSDLKEYGVGKITGAGGKKHGAGFILFLSVDPEKTQLFLQEKRIPFISFIQDFHGVQYQESS